MLAKRSVDNEFSFVYDGDMLLGEADLDGYRAVYIWGLLGPIARIDLRSPAATRYYVIDGLGHTRLLLDSSGSITDRYSYDAWGNPIEQVGNTFNPFRWNAAAGYEWTPATGLYHVGAREHDPRTARWLQKDPIDVASGDPNLYRYCGNDPVNAVDPSGLDWLDDATNFFAGWGDTLTFGVTGTIRQWIGVDDVVNRCSGWYQGGQVTGVVHTALMGGAAAAFTRGKTASAAFRQVAGATTSRPSALLPLRAFSISEHALSRMAERGITRRMVQITLLKGTPYWDPKNKTINYVLENAMASGKSIVVGLNPLTSRVTTVIVMRRLPIRYQPLLCR